MPVKRRNAKRRIDLEALAEIWSTVFASGCDFFRELPGIGVAIDEYGHPDRDAARQAWQVFGAQYVLTQDPAMKQAWAEREFGRPWLEDVDDAG